MQIDAILCADLHLRDDTPLCRTDNYWEAQKRKLEYIFDLADKNNCPIIIAGDLGHKPKWDYSLLNLFINLIFFERAIKVFCIPGQHDLQGQEEKDIDSTAYGVLYNSGIISSPEQCVIPFESIGTLEGVGRDIGITHQMIIENKPLWPGQIANKAKSVLKNNPQYDLIVSGDNHLPFVTEYKGRLLVNPGSMMRMTAAQIDHKPRVYLYNAKTNTVKPEYLPIEEGVVSRKHIDAKEERERRVKEFNDTQVQAYISEVRGQKSGSTSFKQNMFEYLKINEVDNRVRGKIMEKMG